MAFMAKDGSKHTNRSTMMQADARHGAKPAPLGMDDGAGDDDGMGQEPQDGKAIAAEHGPAVEITINHGGGKHTVHHAHEDGHTGDSEHPSKEEAHQFADDVAGVGADGGGDMGGGESSDAGGMY